MHIGIPSGSWESKASDSEKIWPKLHVIPFPVRMKQPPETMVESEIYTYSGPQRVESGRCGFQLSSTSWDRSIKNYFTSCDPHHDIYTLCYWQIFWHSIWHIFWHSIWHIFWHSTWHLFWHMFWHIFWHSIWHIFWHIFWHPIWQIFWHSIWQTFWHFIWHTFWHFIWHSIWHTFWHSIWHISWHLSGISSGILSDILSISSGILSGRWGPAVHTELGRSQVEVQRCTLSWEGPRLRSSGAHWAGQVPGWGPAVHTELGLSQVEVQRCTLSWEVGE